MGNKDDVELLTYAEVCKILAMKVGTVYSMVARNQIPHVRLGRRIVRFPLDQLRQWIDSCQVLATPSPERRVETGARANPARDAR